MVESCAQRIKRMRTEKQPLKLSRAEKTETWNIADEEDIFMEIMSRVDVKSILSSKAVSKKWQRSISNKYFHKFLLEKWGKNPSFIACPIMEAAMKLYLMDAKSVERCLLHTIDPSQRSQKNFMYMISSFNGLICCLNLISVEDNVERKLCDLQIWICNPCTRETLLLPQGRPSCNFEPSVGVAYGSEIGEYRVFRIFCVGKKIPEERLDVEGYYVREGEFIPKYRYALAYECEVYSSSSGYWKNIGPVPCFPMRAVVRPFRTGHIFVGGKIYWLASLAEPGEILSVDWEGRFNVINLPYEDGKEGEENITDGTFLVNFQGSLALLVIHTGYMDVWVWKGSWELVLWDKILIEDDELVVTVTSFKNNIICVTGTHWHIYDVKTRKWKKRIPLNGFVNPAVFPFTKSILPCDGGVNLLN
ncbi:hypothetical protein CARUB_v10013805mg [Capsella rubella]|uniref:F-box domain-containing protein n=1 Tax=Capsella rubella TaxID=81985 RepID=R0G552_9BRAS|nr:F-box protein At5g07610 [Capsella rubella]EOA30667.1 hypothetical protein CARUB_v10013805mg [Capsella rubella]